MRQLELSNIIITKKAKNQKTIQKIKLRKCLLYCEGKSQRNEKKKKSWRNNLKRSTHAEYVTEGVLKKESMRNKKEKAEEKFPQLNKVTSFKLKVPQMVNMNKKGIMFNKRWELRQLQREKKFLTLSERNFCLPAMQENRTGITLLSNFSSMSPMNTGTKIPLKSNRNQRK